jgi:DNA-binding NarL/FixJ family response regulator
MTLKGLIVDDHEVAREGLGHLLVQHGIDVAGSVSTSDEAISMLQATQFDFVLLDVRMEGTDGIATLQSIRKLAPKLPVLMFSSYDNPTYVARAAALGATDYLLKSATCEDFRDAIERAVGGDALPPSSMLRRVRETMTGEVDLSLLPPELPLTGRETQVLRHIALGLSNREIAGSLEISVETVKEHVQNVLRKAKATDRTDAAVRAVKLGLVN